MKIVDEDLRISGAAMRALLFDDPITTDEAKSAFGDDLRTCRHLLHAVYNLPGRV